MQYFTRPGVVDTYEVEREARRLQAQAMSRGVQGLGRWIKRQLG